MFIKPPSFESIKEWKTVTLLRGICILCAVHVVLASLIQHSKLVLRWESMSSSTLHSIPQPSSSPPMKWIDKQSNESKATTAISATSSSASTQSNSPLLPASSFCWPWSYNVDEWWTKHPTWEVSKQNATHYCFDKIQDPVKSALYRTLYEQQFLSSCETVFQRNMWSSGWGADMQNVLHGLRQAIQHKRPFQLSKQYPWHFAAGKPKNGEDDLDPSLATCPTRDLYCYFLPLSRCESAEVPTMKNEEGKLEIETFDGYGDPIPINGLLKPLYLFDNDSQVELWLYQYATRPQTWLRKRIYDFLHVPNAYNRKVVDLARPCTAIHVRRGDVVHHNSQSRRYFTIAEYIQAATKQVGNNLTQNVLLLSDDHNAIGEAETQFPQYNWMYLERPRFKADEGGWEQHLPSQDYVLEVVVLLSLFELVGQCEGMIFGHSNLAGLMWTFLLHKNKHAWHARVDATVEMFHSNNSAFVNVSRSYVNGTNDKKPNSTKW